MGTTYLDYIAIAPAGAKVSVEQTDLSRIESGYTRSFRNLQSIEVTAKAGVEYGPASGSVALTAKNETELKEEFKTQVTTETKKTVTWSVDKVPDDSALGTVVWKVDVQFGGIRTQLPYDFALDIWNQRKLTAMKLADLPTTNAMAEMMVNCGVTPSGGQSHDPILYPPVRGKTCHHVKFLRRYDDACTIDGHYCIMLDGDHMVVCHHCSFQFIGGPGCDCDHVDGSNVVLVPATDLSPAYKQKASV